MTPAVPGCLTKVIKSLWVSCLNAAECYPESSGSQSTLDSVTLPDERPHQWGIATCTSQCSLMFCAHLDIGKVRTFNRHRDSSVPSLALRPTG